MTTLNKPVARRAITRPAAYGVRAELVIALHPGGIIGIRECGRRSKSEVCFDAAELYVEGVRRRIAKERAEDRTMTTPNISKAAAALGKKGGAAGTGEAKRRAKEHYSAAGKKSGEVRRLRALQRKGAA